MALEVHPFDLLDRRFRMLSTGPRALSVPGDLLGGPYRGRPVPLLEVREALLRRGATHRTRNAVLAELVRRARGGEPWGTGLAGVLLPGLRAIVGPLRRAYPWYRAEIETEAIIGLLEALPRARLDRAVAASLIWAGRRAADRALDREVAQTGTRAEGTLPAWRDPYYWRDLDSGEILAREPDDFDGAGPAEEAGNPEALLLEACLAGVLTPAEVEVIAATRLERVPARAYAERVGAGVGSVRLKRYRAERRLLAWISAN